MTHGPFLEEVQALETPGESRGRIIHFKKDGTDEIAWWWAGDRWIKRKK
jgi:hypothetical protein